MHEVERLFVITGGPGSGKTTLIEALEAAGFARTIEAGRAVIQEQLAHGGDALPWKNQASFAEKMLERDIRSYESATQTGPVFFDRGIPDVIGYLRLSGLPVPAHMTKAAEDFRYHRRVFIAPPWPEIYAQDAERKQDFDEAQRTYDAMVETYTEFGYELVELPRVSVEERVKFVTRFIDIANLSSASS